MACGEIKFLEGGVIKNSTIIGGKMSGTDLSDCIFDAGYITQLKSLDSASAQVVAAALCALTVNDLICLANKIKSLILTDGTATRLTINDSTITNSDFSGGSIKTLKSLDAASAGVIADELGDLNAAKRKALTDKLFGTLTTDETPDVTITNSLPTQIIGDSRAGMLGSPDTWFKFGNYIVPAYTVADGAVKV